MQLSQRHKFYIKLNFWNLQTNIMPISKISIFFPPKNLNKLNKYLTIIQQYNIIAIKQQIIKQMSKQTNRSTNYNTHYRQKSFTTKNQHKKQHAIQHHEYLMTLRHHKSLFPRYDIFSQNNHNNLIVHVQGNAKQDLQPRKQSFLVTRLQQKIQNYQKVVGNRNKNPSSITLNKTTNQFLINNNTNNNNININNSNQSNNTHIKNTNDQQHKQHKQQQYHKLKQQQDDGNNLKYELEQDRAYLMEQRLKMMYMGNRVNGVNYRRIYGNTIRDNNSNNSNSNNYNYSHRIN